MPSDDSDSEGDVELPPWSRTLVGWRQRFVLPFVFELQDVPTLTLEQAPVVSSEHAKEAQSSADGMSTASTVWDAGMVLAAHLHTAAYRRASAAGSTPRRCLDLGSGTGIVGLAAAATSTFSRVVLTDLPSVAPLLERNAERNPGRASVEVEVLPLRWEDAAAVRTAAARGPFDLIVGGDLLYRPPVVEPLLTALSALATEATVVLLAASLQHSPETLRLFKRAAAAAGFAVTVLGLDEQHEQCARPPPLHFGLARSAGASTAHPALWPRRYRSAEVKLIRLQRRSEAEIIGDQGGGDAGGAGADGAGGEAGAGSRARAAAAAPSQEVEQPERRRKKKRRGS